MFVFEDFIEFFVWTVNWMINPFIRLLLPVIIISVLNINALFGTSVVEVVNFTWTSVAYLMPVNSHFS